MENETRAPVIAERVALIYLDGAGQASTMEALFAFEPGDPWAVTATFDHGLIPVRWLFARDLLIWGVHEPIGDGDVRVWPSVDARGRAVVVIELRSPSGSILIQARARDLQQFINRTLAAVPVGEECIDFDVLVDTLTTSDD